jgi:hypothetical protein
LCVRSFRVGAVAQLGERLLCKQDVVGSIPSGSTKWKAFSKDEKFLSLSVNSHELADLLFVIVRSVLSGFQRAAPSGVLWQGVP